MKSVYYEPKIFIIEQMMAEKNHDYKVMQSRYDFLLAAGTKDRTALHMLHDEFYPDGAWDSEREDIIPASGDTNIPSLGHARQQTQLKENFATTVQSEFILNPYFSVQAMLGIPDNMETTASAVNVLRMMRDRNRNVMKAVDSMVSELGTIINLPAPTPFVPKLVPQQA